MTMIIIIKIVQSMDPEIITPLSLSQYHHSDGDEKRVAGAEILWERFWASYPGRVFIIAYSMAF